MRKISLVCVGFLFGLLCTATVARAEDHGAHMMEKAKTATEEVAKDAEAEAKEEAAKHAEEGKKVVAEKADQTKAKAKAKVEEEADEHLYEGC